MTFASLHRHVRSSSLRHVGLLSSLSQRTLYAANQSRIKAASSEMASRIVSITLKKTNKTYRLKVMIQFVSQVLPASSENACSKWLEFGVRAEKPFRTMMIPPRNSSWS